VTINLQKGQRVGVGLQNFGVGLGWDPNDSSGQDFDLDASAFMLCDRKVPASEFFVFFNNAKSPDGSVVYSGADRPGAGSDGDDETLTVDLSCLDSRIDEILFTVTIHDYEARKQNFGQVRNAFIRIYDAGTDEEICKYELDEDFSIETAVEFGRLYKKGDEWKFEAIGKAYQGGLEAFVGKYT